MKKVNLLAAAVVAASLMAPVANAINADFNGYFRAGVFNKHFSKTVGDVGRLGNENDTFGELYGHFGVYNADDTELTLNYSLATSSQYSRSWQSTNNFNVKGNAINGYSLDENNEGMRFANTELFVSAKGVVAFDKDAVVWIGKRYYREDSHLTDWYWRDVSGNGTGIENVQVGPGKFKAAWFRRDDTMDFRTTDDSAINNVELYKNEDGKWAFAVPSSAKYISTHVIDVQYDIPAWDNANLNFGVTAILPQRHSSEYASYNFVPAGDVSNGYIYTIKYNQGHALGWNNAVLRLAHGSNAATWSTAGSQTWLDGTGASNSAYRWEFIDFGQLNFTDNISTLYHFYTTLGGGYDHNLTNVDKTKAIQLVVRPQYKLTKMTRVMLEAGFISKTTEYTNGNSVNQQSQKVTLAYGITPDAGNAWSRPELRFFATYKHCNEEYGSFHTYDAPSYLKANDKGGFDVVSEGRGRQHDVIFGAQAEVWF